jgi:hypothetical protein
MRPACTRRPLKSLMTSVMDSCPPALFFFERSFLLFNKVRPDGSHNPRTEACSRFTSFGQTNNKYIKLFGLQASHKPASPPLPAAHQPVSLRVRRPSALPPTASHLVALHAFLVSYWHLFLIYHRSVASARVTTSRMRIPRVS